MMSAFLISTETMQRVVHAIDKRLEFFGNIPTGGLCTGLDKIGMELFKLNEAAVNKRYPHSPKQVAPKFLYRPLGEVPLADQYNAINCLLYQCSEGNIPERDEYKTIDMLRDKIAHDLANIAVRAAKVPWDWPER